MKYNQNDKVKENEMGWACSTNGRKQECIQDLLGKPHGKKPLGRPGRRWDKIADSQNCEVRRDSHC
jgi:hypothetical protein